MTILESTNPCAFKGPVDGMDSCTTVGREFRRDFVWNAVSETDLIGLGAEVQ